MDPKDFWALIEDTRVDDSMAHADRLTEVLAKRPVEEIIGFGTIWESNFEAAYTWPLWAAAYVLNGGCSDDGFMDFRSWLILRGESWFTQALVDPDSLADLDLKMDEATCECYIGPTAYERASGGSSQAYYDAVSVMDRANRGEPSGTPWEETDEGLKAAVPRLFAKYNTGG